MPVVRVHGLRLHCQQLGDGGSRVVMLHGLVIGNMATWYFTAAHGLSKTHRVLLYDLRGHGKSEPAESGYDLATMAADLEGLLEVDALGVGGEEKLALVGHSYGGLVALRFALRHPERVSRLALVDVPLSPASIAVGLEPDLEAEGEALFSGLPEFLQESLTRGSRRARHLLASLELLLKRATLVDDLKAEPEITEAELATIRCPVLCLYGDQSWFVADGATYAEHLPDARRVVIPGRHHLPIESADLVSQHLEEFLHG